MGKELALSTLNVNLNQSLTLQYAIISSKYRPFQRGKMEIKRWFVRIGGVD